MFRNKAKKNIVQGALEHCYYVVVAYSYVEMNLCSVALCSLVMQ